MGTAYRPIERLQVFEKFESVSDAVWNVVANWDYFAKSTIGEQLVRASDSVGANLVEGDGRGTDPDAIRFFRYSRASAREARLWIGRAIKRQLIDREVGEHLISELEQGAQLLNGLIKFRHDAKDVKNVKEERSDYHVSALEAVS